MTDLVEECDLLAAHPDDPQRMAEGVDDDRIVPRLAILACEDAAKREPGDPRFVFQLGRAVLAKGDRENALRLFQDAAKKNYAAAYGYIGDAYQFGYAVQVDPAVAHENYRKAFELGFKAAERQLEQLDFDPAIFAAPHVNVLFASDIGRIRSEAGATTDAAAGVRNYVFSFTQGLMEECDAAIAAANIQGFYQFRFPSHWTAESDDRIPVTIQTAIGQHDAKTFLRRYGCEGPVAKHIFTNLNRLFAGYNQR